MRLFSTVKIIENMSVIVATICFCSEIGGMGTSISLRVRGFSSF